MDPEELKRQQEAERAASEPEDGEQLSEQDLAGELLIEGVEALAEAQAPAQRVIAPKDGKRGAIREDGTVRIAIMRPCVSRGKRIRGLPPIYTPKMLAENASVFTGWPMYVGHLHPLLQAKIREVGRSPADLGGRVVKSWYDPEIIFEDDQTFGFQKGGIVGDAIPYELAESILSRDPHGLHASVNAWPKGATVGRAPWNSQLRGMLIEGIRSQPIGSVDWVVRGGAGGRVDPRSLSEGERAVITILESCYGSAEMDPDFAKMTPEQLAEWLREHHEHLVPALAESVAAQGESGGGAGSGGAGSGGAPTPPANAEGTGRVPSVAEFQQMMQEHATTLQASISSSSDEIEKRAEQKATALVQEREALRRAEKAAHALIESADGLTPGFKAELRGKYTLLPSGATESLICEAEVEDGVQTKSADEVLEARVKEDIEHYAGLIRESQGKPHVRHQGGGGGDPTSGGSASKGFSSDDPLVEFLTESGGIELGDDPAKHGEKVLEALSEAATD